MKKNLHLHRFPSREALAEQLAEEVAQALNEAAHTRGKATLVVSGGGTPRPFFEALKQRPLDWSALLVTVADERWVPTDHPDSNEHLVRECLLNTEASKEARFVSLYNGASSAQAGEEAAEEALRSMTLPFDVTILGMGPDGHTASLFPHHPRLEDALESRRLCFGIEDAPKPPPERMTLTRHALLHSRRLFLHITGEDKLDVLERAEDETSSADDLPIRAFLHQDEIPLEIYWAA
jgi:6-phosphogluconolactonase